MCFRSMGRSSDQGQGMNSGCMIKAGPLHGVMLFSVVLERHRNSQCTLDAWGPRSTGLLLNVCTTGATPLSGTRGGPCLAQGACSVPHHWHSW